MLSGRISIQGMFLWKNDQGGPLRTLDRIPCFPCIRYLVISNAMRLGEFCTGVCAHAPTHIRPRDRILSLFSPPFIPYPSLPPSHSSQACNDCGVPEALRDKMLKMYAGYGFKFIGPFAE